MRDRVDLKRPIHQRIACRSRADAPFPLEQQPNAGLVLELIVPSHRFAVVDDLMDDPLRVLGVRGVADDAEIDRESVEPVEEPVIGRRDAYIGDHANRSVEKAGVGPLESGPGVRILDVLRREHALPDRRTRSIPTRSSPGRGQLQGASRARRSDEEMIVAGRDVGQANAVRVVAVGPGEDVVLPGHRVGAFAVVAEARVDRSSIDAAPGAAERATPMNALETIRAAEKTRGATPSRFGRSDVAVIARSLPLLADPRRYWPF